MQSMQLRRTIAWRDRHICEKVVDRGRCVQVDLQNGEMENRDEIGYKETGVCFARARACACAYVWQYGNDLLSGSST